MTKLEKVIKGLELLKQRLILQADVLGYGEHISDIDNALELLKEREPRVLTLDEVLERQPFHLWVEEIGMEPQVFPVALVEDIYQDAKFNWAVDKATLLNDEDYGKCWRFWSAKPTDEQRMAVKWDE